MIQPRVRSAARRDLIEHFVYLAENGGVALADRFLQAAEDSFHLLATQPLIGSIVNTRHASLHGVRKWAVSGFDAYLIFYLPGRNNISVIRVLHGARDWWRLLGLDEQ